MEITARKRPFETPELQIESIAVADIVTESGTEGVQEDMGKYTPWH